VLSGVIPTWQTEPHSGRVYAARGAVFIILALVWGRLFDGFEADRWDRPGAAIHLAGVAVISAGPRGR
jgi:small multidrug resistance family-3 protein